MIFSSDATSPIGLDISDLSLRLVQLKKTGDNIKIQALSSVNLPKGLFENGEIKNKEGVLKAINDLIEKPGYGKVTSREVIACLPETKTFVKLIEVQKTGKDISETIEAEIEKNVPMSLDEIYYDWQIVKDKGETQEILIGAALRTIVDQYTSLLDEAKLSITALEIEPISLCRSLLAEEHPKFKGAHDKNYGIIDIGAKRSNLTVYSKNTILFAFSMPISGEEITEKISKTLKIDLKQAEKAKIICGLDETKAQGIVKDTLYGMIKRLIGKISEALTFYNQHFSEHGPINKIILCGGGANIKDLSKIIKDYINIEVVLGDALINLNENRKEISSFFSETHSLNADFSSEAKNKTMKITQDSSLSFATAIGLALRGLFVDKL